MTSCAKAGNSVAERLDKISGICHDRADLKGFSAAFEGLRLERTMSVEMELPERESMEFDVVIVGAGPAGLSAAIRLKQVNPDLTVVVLEKGSEVGAHILSGAVVDPIGIDRLLPGWREDDSHPFKTEVKDDHFLLLGPAGSVRLPNFAPSAWGRWAGACAMSRTSGNGAAAATSRRGSQRTTRPPTRPSTPPKRPR